MTYETLTRCPHCGKLPTVDINANDECVISCCSSAEQFISESQMIATVMWNKWASGKRKHTKDSTELSGGHLW